MILIETTVWNLNLSDKISPPSDTTIESLFYFIVYAYGCTVEQPLEYIIS